MLYLDNTLIGLMKTYLDILQTNCKILDYVFASFLFNFFARNAGHIIDGLLQDCSHSIANALRLLQSCTKPSIMRQK